MMCRNKIVSVVFVVLRVYLASRFFNPLGWGSAVYGISELWACASTVFALRAGQVDKSGVGILLPFMYLAPTLFSHWATPNLFVYPLVGVSLLQVAMRYRMGQSLTVGVPVFVKLRASGPYKLMRHPLATVELLSVLFFFATFPSPYNAVVLFGALGAGVAGVMIEEHFLTRLPQYQSYMRQVPNRFVPRWT